MNDDWAPDWVSLAAQRERWLRVRLRHERLLPARLAVRAHTHFAAFVEEVFGAQGRPGSLNLEVSAAAIVFFGPPGPPPPEVWNDYVTLYRELVATASDAEALNVFDLVLAFGCGWRRPIDRRRGGWWGRWETAYATMINQVRASLVATGGLLDNQFPQFSLNDDDLLELPGDFTVSLLGSCDCAHHLRGCQHRCGRECCFPAHDLGSWDPLKCHLRPFVDQAVRGTATKQILGAAFAESLTYRELERQGRMLRRRGWEELAAAGVCTPPVQSALLAALEG